MSEGPFSEIHGVRIKLQTLTYLFLIMIIRRKNYLEFRRKIHPTQFHNVQTADFRVVQG